MFLDKDARDQRVWRVVAHDQYGPLNDNRSVIEFRGHQMDGDAGHRHAVLEGLAGRVNPWEGRQQGRMDVENGVAERLEQWRPNQAHVARKADKTDIARAQFTNQCAVVLIARR